MRRKSSAGTRQIWKPRPTATDSEKLRLNSRTAHGSELSLTNRITIKQHEANQEHWLPEESSSYLLLSKRNSKKLEADHGRHRYTEPSHLSIVNSTIFPPKQRNCLFYELNPWPLCMPNLAWQHFGEVWQKSAAMVTSSFFNAT